MKPFPEFDPRIGRGCRVAAALRHQLSALAGGVGFMVSHEERSWRSNTFDGTRHKICWEFTGADEVANGEVLVAQLPEHDIKIAGQLVVDATVMKVDHRAEPPRLVVDMELLLLEAA